MMNPHAWRYQVTRTWSCHFGRFVAASFPLASQYTLHLYLLPYCCCPASQRGHNSYYMTYPTLGCYLQ